VYLKLLIICLSRFIYKSTTCSRLLNALYILNNHWSFKSFPHSYFLGANWNLRKSNRYHTRVLHFRFSKVCTRLHNRSLRAFKALREFKDLSWTYCIKVCFVLGLTNSLLRTKCSASPNLRRIWCCGILPHWLWWTQRHERRFFLHLYFFYFIFYILL